MTLHLLPNLLAEGLDPKSAFVPALYDIIPTLDGIIGESERNTRRYLKLFREDFRDVPIELLNEHQREVQWDKIRYLEDWIHTFEPSESIQRAMQVQQILQVRVAVLEERVDQLEEDLDFYGISYD